MEKFTIAERFTSETETPINTGDKVKIVSMEEFDKQGIKFWDRNLMERLADKFYQVKKIEKYAGIFIYFCTDTDGKELPIQFVDTDIEYVLR